jgi:hypothetical protein
VLSAERFSTPYFLLQPTLQQVADGKLVQIDGCTRPDMSAASSYVPTGKDHAERCGTNHDRSVHQYALSTR